MKPNPHSALQNAILEWDGKSASAIKTIYLQFREFDEFQECSLSMLKDAELQRGASYLLKQWLSDGGSLSAADVKKIHQCLPSVNDWQALLHLLQSAEYLPVGKAEKSSVEFTLRRHLTHPNTFVRAWAFHAFYWLARQYPEYRADAEQFLNMAMADEPASVKARVRHLQKLGF